MTRETNFHHVTYKEANKLREHSRLACTRSDLSTLGYVRICAEGITKTPLRGRGPRCRECGQPIGLRRPAISFFFLPHATKEDPSAGHMIEDAWLHLEPCPGGRP